MKIYIDADHNGFEFKQALMRDLRQSGYEVIDVGEKKLDPSDDFPLAAAKVAHELLASNDKDAKGILICGSGQGVCMAANRFKGIRASLCWDNREAKAARNDDDSNVLCLPARSITVDKAKAITHVWLHTSFAGAPRFKRRINQLDELG
jgi:ribose 5-phosphate isomerase B